MNPFLSLLPVGVIGAAVLVGLLVGLAVAKSPLKRSQHRTRTVLVKAVINAGRTAARWPTLNEGERSAAKNQAARLDFMVRVSGLRGANTVASWTRHKLSQIRRDAMNGHPDEDLLADFETQLSAWHQHPSRRTALFRDYVELWERTAIGLELDVRL
ncbi:hypothetical protein [Subtercola endophyticus]|uniref:hypothetical protein n=1 Tax=Subtercola endophyticus TaxID=2895559 RepID=UPI001E527168|nr:hypothetical protein [Subtercola endophyticus]UFS58599.1 hypothetical protein LQ955_16615 [Subtercola endophyticus]